MATAALDRLQARAYDLTGETRAATRLVVQRLVQRRPEDAAARAAADAITDGGWGRIEWRAWMELGADAPPSRVAAWMTRQLGLDRS
jgi:hypothetical protein